MLITGPAETVVDLIESGLKRITRTLVNYLSPKLPLDRVFIAPVG
jgi:hypothetical protein